jgi:uncharacterized protein YkwD
VKQAYVLVSSIVFALTAAVILSLDASAAEGGMARQCGGGQISLEAKEYETFVRHNRIRRDRGLPAFCVDPKLTRAAETHSQDMMDRDYFDHDTKGSGATFDQRIKDEGYRYRTAGENIAWGSGSLGSPANIMKGWMRSDGHRKNILNKGFREVGIGVAEGTYGGIAMPPYTP